MANIQTKLKAFLQAPLVRKIGGQLVANALPKLRAKIGEDPVIAFGGLATFLAWAAGRLPQKIARPVQGLAVLLGIFGAKATVTPAAAPKVVVKATVPGTPAPLTVKVPLVTPPVEHVEAAVKDAVAKATGALGGVLGGVLKGVGKVVPGAAR